MERLMTDQMRVLVTGASGFIGTRVAALLLEKGYAVRGTLRSQSRAGAIKDLIAATGAPVDALSFVEADLMSDQGWDAAVDGCTYVQHVASPLPIKRPKDEQELIRPAVDGTLRVLKAASSASVRRVVVTSSVAAIAYGRGGQQRPFTEDDWSDPDSADIGSYEKSKTLAERAAWDFHERTGGFELAVVNPSLVLGPVLEKDFGSSAEVIRQIISGQLPVAPRIGYPIVDVRDVADLHLRAMEHHAAAGNRFIAASGFYSMLEMATILRTAMPALARRMPKREAPNWLIRLMGRFDSAIGGVTFELGQRRAVSHDKARRMLGWSPRTDEETLTATARSLILQGVVKG